MTSGADAFRPEDSFSLAAFFLGDGLYGIDIMKIKEVIHAAPYAVRHVPHAPETIEGVIEVRGVVIPVMDLQARFGLIATEASRERAKFIVGGSWRCASTGSSERSEWNSRVYGRPPRCSRAL